MKHKRPFYTNNALEALVANKKIPMLFVGAGFSRRYLENYPRWEDLLSNLQHQLDISEDRIFAIKQKITDKNPLAPRGEINKKIAQFLTDELIELISSGKKSPLDFFSAEEYSHIKKNNIPLIKALIAKQLKTYQCKVTPKEKNELKELKKLQKNIGVVLTTNYDTFLEDCIFTSFLCFEEQHQYYRSSSVGIGEIYKIHGSVTKPQSLIFNEEDYKNYNNNLRVVVAKILTLLLDYPIVFLGYSLDDENIQDILLTLIDCLNPEQLAELNNNLIYVSYTPGQHKLITKKETRTVKNKSINLTVIETDNYFVVYKYLQKFQPSIRPDLLRKYKKLIKDLVNETTQGVQKIFVKEEDLEKLGNTENLVIAFGKYNELLPKSFTTEQVVDMVLENKKISKTFAKSIIEENYLKSHIASKQTVPVFYFTKLCPDYNENIKIQTLKTNINNFVKTIIQDEKISIYSSYKEISESLKTPVSFYKAIKAIIKSFALEKINYQDYINALKLFKVSAGETFKRHYTNFKKAVTYADLK